MQVAPRFLSHVDGSALRGVGTLHCVLAFFFNATLLALSINIAAGLL